MKSFTIPVDRLPPGFAEKIDAPPAIPAEPKPAATAVLLRQGPSEAEVLLLQRHHSSGFVPGAYVFPGGRVDAADHGVSWPGGTSEPSTEYWVAAVREVFEETGVLLARDGESEWALDAATDPGMQAWREALLLEQASLQELLESTHLTLDPGALCYLAHWITPVAEPRRYDTRFFLARMPAGRMVLADPREMTDALWLSPRAALARFENGSLPMVFPTIRTLEMLAQYERADQIFDAFYDRVVEPVLPRLVRSGNEVGFVIDSDQ